MRFLTSCCHLAASLIVTSLFLTQHCNADVICSNPPPGVAKMVRGVDITTVDFLPLETISAQGIKSPIINFTCNGQLVWTSPTGTEYQLPDQIWSMTSTPGGWSSAQVRVYKSGNDIRKWMNRNAGIEGTFSKFSFSGSHSFEKMQHTITNSSKVIEDVSAFESATRVDIIPEWVLGMDRLAQMYVDRFLTGTFETNRAAYERFVDQFGTHYFSSANFGGFIRSYMETNEDYVYSKSHQEVKNNAKASFFKAISAHGGTVHGSTSVSEAFRRSSSTSLKYYGGDTNLLATNGIQQWQPTVDNDPWLFSGKLKPITNLIADAVKKDNLNKAVTQHVLRAYLNEQLRLVLAAKVKVSDATLNSLQSRIVQEQGKPDLTVASVESIGRDVTTQLSVPSWFRETTQLCYKWRPDGDGGQCGGGAGRHLCSNPNSRTAVYRDDTDGRGGGCRMQWGITSRNQPSWFNQVKICYRWHPDGDGGQCGGGARRLMCAPINSFTPEYRDDTDGRGGGCQMSWKLDVPTTAPLWLRSTQLCYYWYPDGDGGQCGGSAGSRTLCASARSYTQYYRDDTDGRGGGCRMSWAMNVVL